MVLPCLLMLYVSMKRFDKGSRKNCSLLVWEQSVECNLQLFNYKKIINKTDNRRKNVKN